MKMESFKQYLNRKTLEPEAIAKKHGVSVSLINAQLKIGIQSEKEHTTHDDIAREIALDHLGEDPKYYTKLRKMENN